MLVVELCFLFFCSYMDLLKNIKRSFWILDDQLFLDCFFANLPWSKNHRNVCFNLRRPRGSSSGVGSHLWWNPVLDSLSGCLACDTPYGWWCVFWAKDKMNKIHQEGGGCFRPYLRCACSPAKRSHRFRFRLAPKRDPFILAVAYRCTCDMCMFQLLLTLICQGRLWIDFVCCSGDRIRYWLHHHQFMNSINNYLLYMTWTLDVFKKTFLPI